ncbi:hypothetical protein EOL73_00660 [Candidatus Saccharibacteria bacterium]|nr:hypothetical protein [Candidatus Saccharibacteria bacterium]NCU40254.1 hypothetical protein [Candidatus Saccharibacteria bacterium]
MNPQQPHGLQPDSPLVDPSTHKPSKKIVISISIGVVMLVIAGILLYLWLKPSLTEQNESDAQSSTKQLNDTNNVGKTDKMTDETKTTEENNEQPVSENCLTPADAHDFFGVEKDYIPQDVVKYFYSETIYFNADSNEYSNPDAARLRYDKMAEFYNKYSKEVFLYYIQATTYEDNTSSEGLKIAQARADRAKQELTSRQIPASYIVVEQPKTSTYNAESMRNVVITIRGSSDC